MVPVPIDVDTYLGNSQEYTNKVHVQYVYIVISPDLYIPLTEPHLKLCTCMGIVY